MKRLWLLTKVQIRNSLAVNGRTSRAGLSSAIFVYGILAVYSLLIGAAMHQAGFVLLGTAAFIMVFISSIFSFDGRLIGFADYDFLMSLPFTSAEITAAKLISFFTGEYLIAGAFFLPGAILYLLQLDHVFLRMAMMLIGFLFLPGAGAFIGSMLGYGLLKLTGGKKYQKQFRQIFSIAVFVLIWAVSMRMDEYAASASVPIIDLYLNGIIQLNGLSFLLYLLISGGLMAALIAFYGRSLAKANDLAHQRYHNASFTLKASKIRTVRQALWHREFSRFLKSPVYLLNCGFGTLLCIGFSIYGIIRYFLKGNTLSFGALSSAAPLFAVFGIAIISSMSSPTSVSLSLEGKSLWLLKVIPVKTEEIFRVKMRLNRVLSAASSISVMAVSLFYVHYSVMELILSILLLVLCGLFDSLAAMLIGIFLCRLKWDSEAQVIKQSAASALGVFGPMAVLVITAVLSGLAYAHAVSVAGILGLDCLIYAVLCLLAEHLLKTKGKKKFAELI